MHPSVFLEKYLGALSIAYAGGSPEMRSLDRPASRRSTDAARRMYAIVPSRMWIDSSPLSLALHRSA